MSERWAPIPCHPGYEASDQGRVRSVDRTLTTVQGWSRFYPGRILSPYTEPLGYQQVNLGGTIRRVHCVVLETFVGPAPDGHEGCHNNGEPSDNRLSNLRWDTHAANNRDAIKHGTNRMTRRTHCPRGHALVPPNLVRSQVARGKRSCLACDRAKAACARLRARGREVDAQQIADEKYAQISDEVTAEISGEVTA